MGSKSLRWEVSARASRSLRRNPPPSTSQPTSKNTLAPSGHESQHQSDGSQLQNQNKPGHKNIKLSNNKKQLNVGNKSPMKYKNSSDTRQTVSVSKDDQELGWKRSERVKSQKKCTCCLSSNALLNTVFLAMMCLCIQGIDMMRYVYVKKSETVLLHCQGKSDSIEWKKGGLGIQHMTENEVVFQKGGLSLELKNVSCASQGKYECMFHDTNNKTWYTTPFFLMVNMKPEIELTYTYNPQYMAFDKNGKRKHTSKLEIECKVKSCSMPTVVMIRDGENIKESNIFNRETVDLQDVQNGHILTIRDPIIKDFSTYMCLAENNQGQVIRSINLKQEIDLMTRISLGSNGLKHIITTTHKCLDILLIFWLIQYIA
jgi:hypothetical protein